MINHSMYHGKSIRELVQDIPEYAVNYYMIVGRGCVVKLSYAISRGDILGEKIVGISSLLPDYTYDIYIK